MTVAVGMLVVSVAFGPACNSNGLGRDPADSQCLRINPDLEPANLFVSMYRGKFYDGS